MAGVHHRDHAFGLLMSLDTLIEFGDRSDYTGADLRPLVLQVGFSRTEVLLLVGPSSAASAHG